MKNKRVKLIGFCFIFLTLTIIGGCSGTGELKEVRSEEFRTSEFDEILVDYDGESIFVGESDHGQVVVETDLVLSELKAETTNGEIMISGLTAVELTVKTTNGEVQLENISGKIHYESTNGNLTGSGLSGSGNFNVSANGNLNLAYSRINEDLSAYTKNGEIKLALPSGLDFNFCAKTKNGEIKTNFSKQISGSEHALQGIIGDNPNVLVNLETKNGNMDIEYLNPE